MTEILFGSAAFTLFGYLIGKLFVRLNPLLMLVGFSMLVGVAPVMIAYDNKHFATVFFVIGIVLNFNRPLSYARNFLSDLFGTMKLRRLSTGYADNIQEQKHQAEQELYDQKRQVEEDLQRQKYQAEQDIQRQRREAEESLRKEREAFERDKANSQSKHSDYKSRSSQSSGSQSKQDTRHLNPRVFPDACAILDLGQGCTLKQYKAAYVKLMKLYHADRLAGLSAELRKQEEEKAKTLNVAWETIKKKLR